MRQNGSKVQPGRVPRFSGILLMGLGACAWACSGTVEVGDPGSSGGAAGDGDGDTGGSGGMGGAPGLQCAEEDAAAIAGYAAYQEAPNAWGELLGRTYAGYIEGVVDDLLLVIEADGVAVLTIGTPAPPPEADKAYLCDDAGCTSFDPSGHGLPGATYELHGALFEQGRLRIQLGSAFDPWCKLQTPTRVDHCHFGFPGEGSGAIRPEGCWFNDQEVDCSWLYVAQRVSCQCTSTECFDGPSGELDARLQEDGDIVGTLWGGALHLFQED